ncbi:MAG: 4-hydroxythreonine-4-phosphate dehydrogenase PdxA [Deltaproteobacteria bacterium]|nr:4-hydroxythreonine-4-phosphate dehydrogenase PdxA [Deltaproteobacteria bacterium]
MSGPLLLTPGDPLGVGAEVTCKALLSRRGGGVAVVGAWAPMAEWGERLGLPLRRVEGLQALPERGVGVIEPRGDEPVEVRSIRFAVEACLGGDAAGLVTGPIHKARLAAHGFPYPGHTDFLGHLCGVASPVMAFTGGSLRVALVTVHLPLSRVAEAVTVEAVLHTLRVAHQALIDQVGIPSPRLILCGLNPHAGDDGLLGREELEVIGPAAALARREGISVHGPVSAEGAFLAARRGEGDMVVAMYHDQGLAPLKLVDFGRSVNWTLGLPIIRTSVDHGTADGIAGQGIADPASMIAALDWAEHLTLGGRARG